MATNLKVEISYKQIWKIALPIALALLVPQLNLIINGVFLGHYSEQSLAIASITGVYYLVFAGIGFTQFITPVLLKTFLSQKQADLSIDFLRIRIMGLPFLYVYQLRNAL